MTKSIRTITLTQTRRLAIASQRLAGERPPATPDGILQIFRDLGCVQIDPISAVARSHLIVLWSRLGIFDPAALDTLLWQDRKLFEYWAHCASMVLTQDYPMHNLMMRDYANGDSPWSRRVQKWLAQNDTVRRNILATMRRKGPQMSRDLGDAKGKRKAWVSTGWTSGHTTSRLLDFLWLSGTISVVSREGIQKVWDLSKKFLPEWTPREKWNEHEVVYHAAQKSLRALGVATPRQITQHFIRGRYPNLAKILDELEHAQLIERVQIVDDGKTWDGAWYIHANNLAQLDQTWQPRTTLLSPFDNLICDRARTKQLFNFDYTIEIYVPAAKRKYGYYCLPILRGDQLIGRIDAETDRVNHILQVNAVYAEKDAPTNAARGIAQSLESLAQFVGATQVEYSKKIPPQWKKVLH